MFKKTDYIILSIICFFLGIFIVSQFYAGKEYQKVIQPESNSVLALEVTKLTKANAELRREVSDLTHDLESYKNSSESRQKSYDQYISDVSRFDIINGGKQEGQGIIVNINGSLSTPQLVDLVNAIKNIGAEVMAINDQRVVINTNLSLFSNQNKYQIKIIGNSNLLKTAMERKGGIVEQISDKNISFSIMESSKVEIPAGNPIEFNYAKIVKE